MKELFPTPTTFTYPSNAMSEECLSTPWWASEQYSTGATFFFITKHSEFFNHVKQFKVDIITAPHVAKTLCRKLCFYGLGFGLTTTDPLVCMVLYLIFMLEFALQWKVIQLL